MDTTFNYIHVDNFQPTKDGWNLIGNVNYQQADAQTILLTNSQGYVVKISFLSASAFRVWFRPVVNPDYTNDNSYAVMNRNLGQVNLRLTLLPDNGGTLLLDSGILQVKVGLHPYGIAVFQNGQLITEDTYGKNLIFSNEAVANLKNAPGNESYFGLGEKAGNQLDKKSFTLSFFNFDNYMYGDSGTNGFWVVPPGNDGGPLNPSDPLYNSMPFLLGVGKGSTAPNAIQYAYGLFFDNVSQSYFNLGSNDYDGANMDGKYYFGALYGDLDYYVLVGTNNNSSKNIVLDVLSQYTSLVGRPALPPMYALGYHQGCYGYFDRNILIGVANAFRNAQIPIDGLHIDVDFQNNYRGFTISDKKFPNAGQMLDTLHQMGFKCSTNITGIISGNPFDENGTTITPYPTRDNILDLDPNDITQSTYKPGAAVHPFIYNTRSGDAPNPAIFFANEDYGQNNGKNPFISPSPGFPNGNNNLGTYGFYCDMGNPAVQQWWGKQYDYLLQQGIDMVWQDMTCPAVIPNEDNNNPESTLPLDLMMFDPATGQYQPNGKIHNAFALNLVQATYQGISLLKSSNAYQGLYNYKRRNFIIARGGFTGIHRYAGIWTGDSASSWDFLSINIPEVLNIGLSGQPISGCDIGGFATGSGSEGNGVTNFELFTRWMTCGAFLPWYRNHYDGYNKAFQEPYMYGDPVPSNCRKYIEIRYQLLQLFYDAMYGSTQTGMPIARALFLNETADPNVFSSFLNDEFFVGDNLLVAPLLAKGSLNRDVYLPAGSNWYVFDVGGGVLPAPTPGGVSYNWYVPLDLVPVYIREGAILPVRQLEQYVGQLPQNPLTFFIYPGKDSSYQLYEDDHVSTAFQDAGAYRVTQITNQSIAGGRQVVFNRTYDLFAPPEPFFYLSFLGYINAPASVQALGANLASEISIAQLQASAVNAYFYDAANEKVVVKVFNNQAAITVQIAA